jgi:hypothetical protein
VERRELVFLIGGMGPVFIQAKADHETIHPEILLECADNGD